MNADPQTDFDGCNRKCRQAGAHTLVYGQCEHAPEPEPTVSLSRVYTAADGLPAIGFDTYTVPQLARLIEPAVGDPLRAAAAARVIMHREAVPAAGGVVSAAPDQADLRQRIAEALYRREWPRKQVWQQALAMDREVFEAMADAVLAVLPPPADRAAVLRWAADVLDAGMERFFIEWPDEPRNSPYALGKKDAADELRRVADEAQQQDGTETRDALMRAHVALAEQAGRDQAALARVRQLHDRLAEETDLTSPDDPITRGAAAKRIAAALDGWTPPAVSGPRAADDKQNGA